KAGHCEYFASSMAILLRAAGIPTRVINGFLLGEYNPVGRDYIIRESDAHSWVEVYISGKGWVEFDPTPPDPNHREVDLWMKISWSRCSTGRRASPNAKPCDGAPPKPGVNGYSDCPIRTAGLFSKERWKFLRNRNMAGCRCLLPILYYWKTPFEN